MARVSTTAKPNNAGYDVSATYLNAFVADYVSQSDINAQAIASPVNFTNATVTKSGTALATTTNISDHAALTTGVHGVGAGTVAKTSDITVANLSGLPFVTVGPSGCTYTTDGTADEVQINQAITAVTNKGIVRLMPNTTYNLADEIEIVGTATDEWATSTSQLGLIGGGFSTVLNQTAANKNGIVLSNAAQVLLRDFAMIIPAANSGHGIYGDDGGANSAESIMRSNIDNIRIWGMDSTHAGIYIKNPWYSRFGFVEVKSNGDGVVFDATDSSLHIGDTYFDYLYAVSIPSGKTALTLKALATNTMIDAMTFNHLEISTDGIGIMLQVNEDHTAYVMENRFNNCLIEAVEKSIVIDHGEAGSGSPEISHNSFTGDMTVYENGVGIECYGGGSTYSHNTFNFHVNLDNTGAATRIIKDSCRGWGSPNEYNLYISNNVFTSNQFLWGGTYLPKIHWLAVAGAVTSFRNPNSGAAATVNDGDAITHYVGLTPTWVQAVGTVAGEIVTVSGVASDHFHVDIKKRADGSAGTAQTIYWRAGYNSD